MTDGLVLDSGAFVAVERGDGYVSALLQRARHKELALITSAAVVGRVWRGGKRQAPIAIVLRWHNLTVNALTESDGRTIGKMLAASATSDVVDAHIALLARARGWPVITSDPDDLHRLDSTLALWPV